MIEGARRVGKSYVVEEFVRKEYEHSLLISHAFSENQAALADIVKDILFGKLEVNKGMVIENAVAQMLRAAGQELYFHFNDDLPGVGHEHQAGVHHRPQLPFGVAHGHAQRRGRGGARRDGDRRNAVRRKLRAYHCFLQAGAIAQGLMTAIGILVPEYCWSKYSSWMRTMNVSRTPSEWGVQHVLRKTFAELLADAPRTRNWVKFIRERMDLKRYMPAA